MATLEFERQPLVIYAEAVEDGRLQVMRMNRVGDDVVTVVVRLAERHAALDAAARKPHSETARVVIAPVVRIRKLALTINRAPEFTAPDHQRFVEHASILEVGNKPVASLVNIAALQREIGARLAARLDYVKLVPELILDAGCGTGEAIGELGARYPGARIVGFDIALPMVEAARRRARAQRSLFDRLLAPLLPERKQTAPRFVCADLTALPFRGVVADLFWSNLALQWVNDLPRTFQEVRRVLKVGGLFTFTTFGPDTLRELRRAFAGLDAATHTNRFLDMHDIGDMLVAAGFADHVDDRLDPRRAAQRESSAAKPGESSLVTSGRASGHRPLSLAFSMPPPAAAP